MGRAIPDNTLQTGTDTIATDELNIVNGVDVSASVPRIKTERVKVGYGTDGVLQDVSAATPLPVTNAVSVSTSTLPTTSGIVHIASRYFGFTVAETSGGAFAHFRVRDQNITGAILDEVVLSGGESVREWYGPQGIAVPSGTLYLERVSGAYSGTARYI